MAHQQGFYGQAMVENLIDPQCTLTAICDVSIDYAVSVMRDGDSRSDSVL